MDVAILSHQICFFADQSAVASNAKFATQIFDAGPYRVCANFPHGKTTNRVCGILGEGTPRICESDSTVSVQKKKRCYTSEQRTIYKIYTKNVLYKTAEFA